MLTLFVLSLVYNIKLFPVSPATASAIVGRWGYDLVAPNRKNVSRIAAYVSGDCYAITEFHTPKSTVLLCGYYVSPLDQVLGVGRQMIHTILEDESVRIDHEYLFQTHKKAYLEFLLHL